MENLNALFRSVKRSTWRALSVFVDELVLFRAWYNATRPKTEWDRRPLVRSAKFGDGTPARGSNPAQGDADIEWLIICPSWDTRPGEEWAPAGGHFFYEIVETARDQFGQDRVHHLNVGHGETHWHDEVVRLAERHRPKFILCQIEIDPDGSMGWTYDILLSRLRQFWSGIFVMLMYDSVFHLHLARLDRITRRDENCLVAAIDRNVTGLYRGTARCIGPLLLPISRRSLDLLDVSTTTSGQTSSGDLSFVGAIYDYRAQLLGQLASAGISVSVNPHVGEVGSPNYAHYISALRASGETLNFSRAHTFDIPQLKCRVLEATAFDCVVFSDDEELTGTYFVPGQQFVYFESPEDLRRKLDYYADNPDALDEIRAYARKRSRELASTSFWEEITAALAPK